MRVTLAAGTVGKDDVSAYNINNSMREESSEHSTPSESQPQHSKHALYKKRQIRKGRTQQGNSTTHSTLYDIDTSTLSKEDKAKLQRAKNREAAQRSRDTHKQYVLQLETQVQ